MEKQIWDHQISVDSETGEYWHGEVKLQTESEIKAIINEALIENEKTKNFAQNGKAIIHYAAMKVSQTVRSCFGPYCLLLV